ncbi:hypothetical protein H4R19_000381 [Coemansia spiralis]|nr:hypothetical protein H4R19_000381 [Coemansia spiralis]
MAMQLAGLPDPVLRRVLELSVVDVCTKAGFVGNLQLVAVCQRLRGLALPLVFKTMFVRSKERTIPATPTNQDGPDNDRVTSHYRITSNADAVAHASLINLVRRVHFIIQGDCDSIGGMCAAIDAMRRAASVWPSVRSLRLSATKAAPYRVFNGQYADYADEIDGHSVALQDLMPNLWEISTRSHIHNNPALALLVQLAADRQEQLQALRLNYTVCNPPDLSFQQLRQVYLDCSCGFSFRLPRISTVRLEKLALVAIGAMHSWAPFSADGSTSMVEFPALKSLYLDYAGPSGMRLGIDDDQRQSPSLKLHLPRLQSAYIRCLTDKCPVLASLVLPPYLTSLELHLRPSLYHALADTVLPRIGRLVLHFDNLAAGNNSTVDSINRVLQCVCASGGAWLVFAAHKTAPPKGLVCDAVTGLHIGAPATAALLLGTIGRLPQLTHLVLTFGPGSKQQGSFSVPAPGQHARVQPLDT